MGWRGSPPLESLILMPRSESFFVEFDEFDSSKWEAWLDNALSGVFAQIYPERDEDIQSYIIRVFKGLPIRQKDIFIGVLGTVIRRCPLVDSYCERWFHLLRVAQVAKPPVEGFLRHLLASGFGSTYMTGSEEQTALEETLLLAVAKYGVDDWLVDHIWRVSQTNFTFDFGLLCLRVLSWRLDDSCLTYHNLLIPRFETERHRAQYQPEFYLISKRLGCRAILKWFQDFITSVDHFPVDSVSLWTAGLEASLLRHPKDSYAQIVIAELKVRSNRFDAHTLSALAQLKDHREPDLPANFMVRIKDTIGWVYDDPNDLAIPLFAFRNPHEFRSERFNAPLKKNSLEMNLLDRANFLASGQERYVMAHSVPVTQFES